ncbi:MAG: hypothetical protein JWM11_5687 [Planctomycetaceae bacterium]|nr:hypothetical protein [Planctomycetaceae bacterium]
MQLSLARLVAKSLVVCRDQSGSMQFTRNLTILRVELYWLEQIAIPILTCQSYKCVNLFQSMMKLIDFGCLAFLQCIGEVDLQSHLQLNEACSHKSDGSRSNELIASRIRHFRIVGWTWWPDKAYGGRPKRVALAIPMRNLNRLGLGARLAVGIH